MRLEQIGQRQDQNRREHKQQPQRMAMMPANGQRSNRAEEPDQQQQVSGQRTVAGQCRDQIGPFAHDRRFRISPTTSRPRPFSTALAE